MTVKSIGSKRLTSKYSEPLSIMFAFSTKDLSVDVLRRQSSSRMLRRPVRLASIISTHAWLSTYTMCSVLMPSSS